MPQVMDACTNASRRCFNIRFWRRTLRRETPLEAKGKTVLQQASVNVIGNKQNHAILKCPSDSVDWSEKTSCQCEEIYGYCFSKVYESLMPYNPGHGARGRRTAEIGIPVHCNFIEGPNQVRVRIS